MASQGQPAPSPDEANDTNKAKSKETESLSLDWSEEPPYDAASQSSEDEQLASDSIIPDQQSASSSATSTAAVLPVSAPPTKKPSLLDRFRQSLEKGADAKALRSDSRGQVHSRWYITSINQIKPTSDGGLQFTDQDQQVVESFRLAKIANIYLRPQMSELDKVDVFVWLRTPHPGQFDQIYSGTLDLSPNGELLDDVKKLKSTLALG
jgi:hypothetical protein